MRSFLVVCLLAGVVCAGSAGAAPAGWSAPVLVDHQPPFASFGGLEGISCTSASLCIAIDIEQNVVASANPTGGAGAWSWSNVGGSNYVDLASYGLAVSCQSPPLCVAVAGQTILTSTNPTGGPSAWTAT